MKKRVLCLLSVICMFCAVGFAACGGESGGSNISTAYTVTVSVSETGYGTVDIDKIENVTLNTAINVNGKKLAVGETVITATASEKTAQYTYAFDKWIAAEKVTGDITVTALFTRTVNKYTVTIETDDGSAIDPIQFDYGTPVSALNNVTITAPEHCHLDKWQKKTGENTYSDFAANEKITGDITVKAVYVLNTYIVTIQSNNEQYGTVDRAGLANVLYGTPITVNGNVITIGETSITATEKEPEGKRYYSFIDFTDYEETVTCDILIMANFAEMFNTCTVTFEMGIGDAIGPIKVEYGTYVSQFSTLKVIPPEHYHLDKWQIKTGESGYEDLALNAKIIDDITVKALFEIDTFNINIASNNQAYGTVSETEVENVPYGTAVTVSGNKITVGETEITATKRSDSKFYNITFTGFTGYTATVTCDMDITATFVSELTDVTGADAYDYLVNNATTSFISHYHGAVWDNGRNLDGDTIAVTVNQANSNNRSFALSKAAITAIYDLGYDEMNFNVDAGTDYFAISFQNDTKNLEYLSGATPADKVGTEYFYSKGSSVTVNISALVKSAEFMDGNVYNNVGLFIWAADSDSLGVGGAPTITLSDIGFKKKTAFTVNIASNNALYGTVSQENVMNVPYGTAVIVSGNKMTIGETVITATENDTKYYDRTFTGFTGYTATVTSDMNVTANFTSNLSAETGADAYDYLVNNATTALISQYHGSVWSNGRTLDGDTIVVTVNQANSGNRSFALSKAAITAIYNLGYSTITFNVDAGTDRFAISFQNDTKNLEYLSGATPADKVGTEYFYSKGSSVTVNISALVKSAEFMDGNVYNNVGLFIWAADSDSLCIGGAPTITLSEISFTELLMAPKESALNVLATASNYYNGYYHGRIYNGMIVLSDDDVTYTVVHNTGGIGFMLKNSAIRELYELGFSEMTFTLNTGAGGYCAVVFWEDTAGLSYLSDNYTDTQLLDGATAYYFASGTRVTVDLAALVNNSAFMNASQSMGGGGLCFNVTTAASWSHYSGNDTTITLADIEFIAFA